MHTDVTDAETTEVNTVQRFLQRGVQIGNDVQVNTVSESYVLWQWLIGTSASTGSTTSPAGTIASTSIVADADHFSIVSYTGTGSNGTVGHGLSGAPEMFMCKQRNASRSWNVYHKALTSAANVIFLDQDVAQATDATSFNSTDPTSSVFSVGSANGTNSSDNGMIAYCFRSVPGVCKVGSYVGNGDADGPYIDMGFTPAFFLQKRAIGGTGAWHLYDTARKTYNYNDTRLFASSTSIEYSNGEGILDVLSNGIKIRDTETWFNNNGDTYIYLAMAEIAPNGAYPPIYGR